MARLSQVMQESTGVPSHGAHRVHQEGQDEIDRLVGIDAQQDFSSIAAQFAISTIDQAT
jgi:hypothetical protein